VLHYTISDNYISYIVCIDTVYKGYYIIYSMFLS